MTPDSEPVTSITLGSYALLACIFLPELIDTDVTNVSQGPASLARTLVKIPLGSVDYLYACKA